MIAILTISLLAISYLGKVIFEKNNRDIIKDVDLEFG